MYHKLINPKIIAAYLYDFVCIIACSLLSLVLRFETFDLLSVVHFDLNLILYVSAIVYMASFHFCGLYSGMWRFSSIFDLVRIFKATTYGTVICLGVLFTVTRLENIPRSFFILEWVTLILALGGGRFIYRLIKDYSQFKAVNMSIKNLKSGDCNALIIGAGSAGERLYRDIIKNYRTSTINVIGFVDDDPVKLKRSLHGRKVIGYSKDIPDLVKSYNIKKLYLAIPSATSSDVDKILTYSKGLGLDIKILPKVEDIIEGKIEVSLLRNVQIEDLLGREAVSLDEESIEFMIKDKVAMVTGAGGSIGSELCNQLLKHSPKKIILFEICELFLYELEMNLKARYPQIEIVCKIGDVRCLQRVDEVIRKYKPNILLHAAAYKHVPLMEQNPREAIKANIFGTKNVIETAVKYNIGRFVLVSTDKAVNPTSIMGTSKRIAEMVCENIAISSTKTKVAIVRFGNVLGSSGSVIPLFKKQIEAGGPITVTHPEVTRYFMSIPEASQLVLQAATMSQGRDIFVLDMGEPIKIDNLVNKMISLAGLKRGEDIKVEYTGLRPGEKMYEELFEKTENLHKTTHKKVFRAINREIVKSFTSDLNDLDNMLDEPQKLYERLKYIVPEFSNLN